MHSTAAKLIFLSCVSFLSAALWCSSTLSKEMRLILLPLALAAILSVRGSEEERTFPTGTCEYPDFDSTLSLKVYDGPTCHRICNHHNLTSSPGTYPDVELDCIITKLFEQNNKILVHVKTVTERKMLDRPCVMDGWNRTAP